MCTFQLCSLCAWPALLLSSYQSRCLCAQLQLSEWAGPGRVGRGRSVGQGCGQKARCCIACYPLPCGHRVQPSASCWGSLGSTPRRGCVRFPFLQIAQLLKPCFDASRDGTLCHAPLQVQPCTPDHLCPHASPLRHHLDSEIARARLALRPRLTRAIIAFSPSASSPTQLCTHLQLLSGGTMAYFLSR